MGQGPNAPYTHLDKNQITQRVFEESQDRLRVDATVSLEPGAIVITDLDDSIAIGDGTGTHATITTIGPKKGLDVNMINPMEVIIDASNDSIAIENAAGTALVINADGSTNIDTSLKIGGVITEMTMTTSWQALPATPLANRKALVIQNYSGVEMKVNYTNSVGYVGMKIKDGGERSYNLAPGIIMYGRATAGTAAIAVEEVA